MTQSDESYVDVRSDKQVLSSRRHYISFYHAQEFSPTVCTQDGAGAHHCKRRVSHSKHQCEDRYAEARAFFSSLKSTTKYKAIVLVFFNGGVDSWNILVPNSGCKDNGADHDLFDEYSKLRKISALTRGQMLSVPSPNDRKRNKQPCNSYGINPGLANIKKLYSRRCCICGQYGYLSGAHG